MSFFPPQCVCVSRRCMRIIYTQQQSDNVAFYLPSRLRRKVHCNLQRGDPNDLHLTPIPKPRPCILTPVNIWLGRDASSWRTHDCGCPRGSSCSGEIDSEVICFFATTGKNGGNLCNADESHMLSLSWHEMYMRELGRTTANNLFHLIHCVPF